MHETEDHAAERPSHAAAKQSDASAVEQIDALTPTAASTLWVRVLASHEQLPHVAVLSVHGEIDLATAPTLREVLTPVLEHQTGPVVVDLSEVSFMDSTGVHVLTEALRRLEPQKRRLAIVCPDGGQVHRLFALLGLLGGLTVYSSRERAVIGGDDLLGSESADGSHLFAARTPTQSLLSARQPAHMPARAASGTGHTRACTVGSSPADAWAGPRDGPQGPCTDFAPVIHQPQGPMTTRTMETRELVGRPAVAAQP